MIEPKKNKFSMCQGPRVDQVSQVRMGSTENSNSVDTSEIVKGLQNSFFNGKDEIHISVVKLQ